MFEYYVAVFVGISLNYIVQTVYITFDEVGLGQVNRSVDEVVDELDISELFIV
jgi:hypothetical protein